MRLRPSIILKTLSLYVISGFNARLEVCIICFRLGVVLRSGVEDE